MRSPAIPLLWLLACACTPIGSTSQVGAMVRVGVPIPLRADQGIIVGVVVDGRGAAVRGVTFVADSPAIGGQRTTETKADGRFSIRLPPGPYKVSFYYEHVRLSSKTVDVEANAVTNVTATIDISTT